MLSAAKPCDGNVVKAQAPVIKAALSLAALGFGRSRAFNKVFLDVSLYLDLIELQQDSECLGLCVCVLYESVVSAYSNS